MCDYSLFREKTEYVMWQELKIEVSSENALPIEEKLFAAGAASVAYLDARIQPVFVEETNQTPLWENVYLVSLFSHSINIAPLISTLSQSSVVINSNDLEIKLVADQDWEHNWMIDFEPMQFGKKLWICPSWICPPDPRAINVILDPGLAFGSGTHPTTSLCLDWLNKNLKPNHGLIDFGCGSGILAIAAALLGAPKVYAVDNDPQAITATSNNMIKNSISDEIIHVCMPETLPALEADYLIANILAEPLIKLSEKFSQLIKPRGQIALSGILKEQGDKVILHYEPWFEIEEPLEKDGWMLITGTRKA